MRSEIMYTMVWKTFCYDTQVIQVKKLVGLPPHALKLLGAFLRFRRAFAEVITFGGASAHKF